MSPELLLQAEQVSKSFGGIVALNRTLDADSAREIVKVFTEVIIAPAATDEAIAIVAAKKNLRLLVTGGLPDPRGMGLSVRTVSGGLLVQGRDNAVVDDMELRVVTKRAPTAAELADLKFAFRICKHVKSNAIVYVKDGATVGIGAGQMSRVDSSRIAAWKAAEAAKAAGDNDAATEYFAKAATVVVKSMRLPAKSAESAGESPRAPAAGAARGCARAKHRAGCGAVGH